MKSTIRVDYDFDKNETFIQLGLFSPIELKSFLESGQAMVSSSSFDLADKHLKNFVEQANNRGINLVYPRDN